MRVALSSRACGCGALAAVQDESLCQQRLAAPFSTSLTSCCSTSTSSAADKFWMSPVSERGRGHVVSKGMVELLDLGLEKRRIRRHSTGIGMMGAAFVRALTKGSRMGLC